MIAFWRLHSDEQCNLDICAGASALASVFDPNGLKLQSPLWRVVIFNEINEVFARGVHPAVLAFSPKS
jgi:hypothetical protein